MSITFTGRMLVGKLTCWIPFFYRYVDTVTFQSYSTDNFNFHQPIYFLMALDGKTVKRGYFKLQNKRIVRITLGNSNFRT